MKKTKIVFYDVTETDQEQLTSHLDADNYEIVLIDEPIGQENLVTDADVISIFVSSDVSADFIEKIPSLKLIACRSTGFNNIDLEAAFERDIAVVNVPSYGSSTVAEYVFALLLALTRKLEQASEHTKQGHLNHEILRGSDLHGKTIGIVGTGRIGFNVARIAKGFGMSVYGYDPYPNHAEANEIGLKYTGLSELVQSCDVISLHAPYTQENHHLLDDSVFNKCKHGAVLINTARGELVDTKALVQALATGKIAGAGLDVLEGEQLLDHHEELLLLRADKLDKEKLQHSLEITALQQMNNVIITKHNAFNTLEAVSRINQTTVENILNFFAGNSQNTVGAHPKGKLVIVRHTESEWNAMGKWTGTTDVGLTSKGRGEAEMIAGIIKDINVDKVYVSEQSRTHETARIIAETLNRSPDFEVAAAINERDYGVYTGRNKWEMKDLVGEEEFNSIRRGWDHPIEDGESLKQVYERAVPFYKEAILPLLNEGKNVLLVAHGNSIRSLVKYIEAVSDKDIQNTEMLFGSALIYTVDSNGEMLNKQLRTIDSAPPPA